MRQVRWGASAAALGMAVLLVAGCSTPVGTPPASGAPAPVPSTPTSAASSPVESAREEALGAYRAMWAAYVTAGETSDWRSPALGEHATGEALSTLSRGLYARERNGLVSRGQPVLDPEVSTVEPAEVPTRVVITDCGDSSGWIDVRADSGEPAEEPEQGGRDINAIVERGPDGVWRVSDFGVKEPGTC